MSRRKKTEEFHRFFTVTEPRTHERGHTEYKVTARFVSKSQPEDVSEVVVWKRFSEMKKLHGELSFTHRNLFRRMEEFPAFPRAQVFGRFDSEVIEERRRASELLLLFAADIPALYNSPQLKEFLRDGEVLKPLDVLPAPLIPLPEGGVVEEETGAGLKPEEAVEALGEAESNDLTASGDQSARSSFEAEGFDSLFDSGQEEEPDTAPPPLSQVDLAAFDPCARADAALSSGHVELLSVTLSPALTHYIVRANQELSAAQEEEQKGEMCAAAQRYRAAVQLFITGAHGEEDEQQREAVKRKISEVLEHTERILSTHQHQPATHTYLSAHTHSHTHTSANLPHTPT